MTRSRAALAILLAPCLLHAQQVNVPVSLSFPLQLVGTALTPPQTINAAATGAAPRLLLQSFRIPVLLLGSRSLRTCCLTTRIPNIIAY